MLRACMCRLREFFEEELASLGAANLGHAIGHDVGGAKAAVEDAADGVLNLLRLRLHRKGVAQHHRRGEHHRERVGDVLAGDVGRGAVDGLEDARELRPDARGREHPDRAREHRRLVAQDVPEDVAGDDGVDARGGAHELHRGVVNVHVRELDVGVLLRPHARHHFAPQLRHLEHVRLVHAQELPPTLLRRLEPDARDALHLELAVHIRVEPHL
mmetsp:Transcript_25913/g.85267  ORF Transcript_25913/g.85267 Transcript_25913/m.85267 type:complete len:214 (+) Transcript_25913:58-699(+)